MSRISFCNAAFSEIDITPDFQTVLVGCHRPDPRAQGVLHRLYAQAVLFRTDNETFCLLAIDSLGLTRSLANTIRSQIAERLNADVSHVMLNFSHTHSAPEPTPFALNGERYFLFLCSRIILCVESAMERFTACKVGWSYTSAAIGENRRDGCSITDHRLGALMVARADDEKPIVLVTRVTAHANVLMRQNTKISSDYIGVAREQLREVFGCPVMILQGAAGNLKPAGVDKVEGGSLDDLHRVADAFVRAAKQLRFEPVDVEDIRMTSIHTSFVSDVPSQEESEKRAARTQHGEADGWLASCDELRQRGVRVQSVPAEIHFFKLNEGCICGVAEEIFCELALAVWDRTENPLLFLNGYTNGCTGYLPTRDEWFKGGYEVYDSNFVYHKYHGHVMPYRAETADLLVERVLEGWEQMGHCRGSGTFPLG